MVPISNVLPNRVAVKNINATVTFTGLHFIKSFFGFVSSDFYIRYKIFTSDHFVYYDPNECKWRIEDQEPCSTADPTTVVSTTEFLSTEINTTDIHTTDITITEVLSTVIRTTEVPATKPTTNSTTEVSTIAETTTIDVQSCEKLDAEWTCSSGRVATPVRSPNCPTQSLTCFTL